MGSTRPLALLDGLRQCWTVNVYYGDETNPAGMWLLHIGYWVSLIFFCIQGAAEGTFLYGTMAFWMSMLFFWQLSFILSDLSISSWYKQVFIGGAANSISSGTANIKESSL